MDLRKQVNTAGAFTLVDDLFIFMVGPNQQDVILKPGVHLSFLSMLNKRHPDIIDRFIKRRL